ncbi:MAG: hypothetical protein EOP38_20450 [Rubrivivax sp.]|nr:MAG: hypothetical protein EOP38_20450 [Rubrivivax sp.]
MLTSALFRDERVLAQAGRFTVLFECQQILLRDDDAGTIGLHAVRENGHDAMYLRAVPFGDAHLVVFDLRDVCPSLDEIRTVHEHDVPGVVRYTLRGRFPTCAEALSHMVARPLDMLPIEPARAHQPEAIAA